MAYTIAQLEINNEYSVSKIKKALNSGIAVSLDKGFLIDCYLN